MGRLGRVDVVESMRRCKFGWSVAVEYLGEGKNLVRSVSWHSHYVIQLIGSGNRLTHGQVTYHVRVGPSGCTEQ